MVCYNRVMTNSLRTWSQVADYIDAVPEDASPARRWQAARTATRRLLRAYGVDGSKWKVEALPPQATALFGDCWTIARTIRYRRSMVETPAKAEELAATIVHEVAHAIVETEHRAARSTGKRKPGHGPMWKGQMAAMGLPTTNRFI